MHEAPGILTGRGREELSGPYSYFSGRERETSVLIPSTKRYRLAAAVALGAAVVSVLGAAPAASARPGRHAIAGSKPRWIGRARKSGTPAAASTIHFGLLLKMRDSAGAEATLASVSDPSSADYGRWLTNDEFAARYAPAAADVRAVTTWLTGQGFRLRDTLGGGMYLETSGTAAQIDRTFGTTIENYTYQGRTVHANSTELSLPSDTRPP